MASLQIHLHSSLIPTAVASVSQPHRPAHFQAGNIDSSQFTCCVFTALALLKIATYDEIRGLTGEHGTTLKDSFAKSPKQYFCAFESAELVGLLDALGPSLKYQACSGSMKTVRRFALERLAADELVILQLGSERHPDDQVPELPRLLGGHWMLAVGTEMLIESGSQAAVGILCLDPSFAAPPVAPFNAKLDIQSPTRTARFNRFITPKGRAWPMTCVSAYALTRVNIAGKFD